MNLLKKAAKKIQQFRWLIALGILFFYLSGCPREVRQDANLNVWGITTNCRNPQGAMEFLEFLLQTDEVLAMTYTEGGPLHLFSAQLLSKQSIPRPQLSACFFLLLCHLPWR